MTTLVSQHSSRLTANSGEVPKPGQHLADKRRECRWRKRIDGADVDLAQHVGVGAVAILRAEQEIGISEHRKIGCREPEYAAHLRYPMAFEFILEA